MRADKSTKASAFCALQDGRGEARGQPLGAFRGSRVNSTNRFPLSLDTQATPSGSEEGQSNGAFHLGRLGQLGLQNLPHTEPGRDGGGRRHHPAQTTVY